MDSTISVFITKYALTKGILQVNAHVGGDMVTWRTNGWPQYAHNEGKDWHRSHEAAIDAAERMRERRIASLKKSIEHLSKKAIKTVVAQADEP